MKIFRLTVGALCALFASASLEASTIDFTYNSDGATPQAWGFAKKETYDVAIRLADAALVGSKVTGMRVQVPVTDASLLGNVSAWLSRELKLENRLNAPDVCSQTATVENQMLSVTFDEPYTITEEGVYVGYTVQVSTLSAESCYPLAVVDGVDANGFFLHASRSQSQWANYSETAQAVSAMVVTLQGEFPENAASIHLPSKFYAKSGDAAEVSVTVLNQGSTPLTSVEYGYTIGSVNHTASITLEEAIPPRYNASASAKISLETPSEIGTYPVEVKTIKANGISCPEDVSTSTCAVTSFIATNRPLVEEYTGMWCINCPAGLGTLDMMSDTYPGEFIAVAYHFNNGGGDPLGVTDNFPQSISAYPTVVLNRSEMTNAPLELPQMWLNALTSYVPANVDVELAWANDEHTLLNATVSATFMESLQEHGYKLGCALLGDNMSDPSWKQRNGLTGQSSRYPGEWYKKFVDGGEWVTGVVYNDVMLSFPNMRGKSGSVPAEVEANVPVSYQQDFDLATIRNVQGQEILKNSNRFRVVGILFDANGTPVTCNTSAYASEVGNLESAISEISADSANAEYFDLLGRPIDKPKQGLIIRRLGAKAQVIRL